ncbi:MAG: putative dependent oxidoreductase [Anaerocolumna sp.]|jgi:hypothetical protein|nr:putative dependent oxidoreductase [Anaerocolumna sp.]
MERFLSYDVVVVGGGSAGIAAAIGASQAGAKTILIERNPYFGGQVTHSNVAAYCGFFTHGKNPKQIVGGVGNMVLEKLKELGDYDGFKLSPAGNAIVVLNPETVKVALDELLTKSDVDILLHSQVIDVTKEDSKIKSIECVDDVGRFTVEGKMFVDATGDANLAYLANVETVFGDGNGFSQASTLMLRIDHIPESVSLNPSILKEAINAAKADGMKYLTKESGIVLRKDSSTDYAFAILPSIRVDALDAQTLTNTEINLRRQAQDYIKAFRKYIIGMEKCTLVQTGPKVGIRESRRIVGEYTLTVDDVVNSIKNECTIARGGWPIERHRDPNKMADYIHLGDDDFYDIPIGMIKPKASTNLWCGGRTVSADSIAFASVRVMGTSFATGHAAGVAAALTIDKEIYNVKEIQEELIRQGAII